MFMKAFIEKVWEYAPNKNRICFPYTETTSLESYLYLMHGVEEIATKSEEFILDFNVHIFLF